MGTRNPFDFTDTTEIHDLYREFSGKLAFDVGACAGKVANIFAERFDRVVALEPSLENYTLLEAHAADNVTPLGIAASDHDGEVELVRRQMSEQRGYLFTGNSLPEWGAELERISVPSKTLDSLAEMFGYPDLVKIDTEGHELLVVQGARVVFLEEPEFIVEIHSEENGEKIHREIGGRVVRHEQHPEGSYAWKNHYWLVSR